MAAPFTIIGLDHVVLRARDPAALEKFYIEVLGCSLELRQGKLAQLRAGRTLIDIVPDDEGGRAARRARRRQSRSPVPARGAVRRGRDRAPSRGARRRMRRGSTRYGAEGRGPSVYLNDPEGNGVELKGPVQG